MRRIIVAIAVTVTLCASVAFGDTSFTPEQQHQIGKIAADYLVQHPHFLIEASKKLQEQQIREQQKKLIHLILSKKADAKTGKTIKDQILTDRDTPWTGAADGKVVIVEFFDYQCMFCSKVNPAFEELEKTNRHVKFIFKDFPIFGGQWSASNYAANVGVTAYKQGGSKLYLKYHNMVFDSGKDEGKLKITDVNRIAKKLSIDLGAGKVTESKDGKNPVVNLIPSIQQNITLGEKLQIMGTPFIVVMPATGANEHNVSVFSGFPAEPDKGTPAVVAALQKAINKAMK